MARIDYFDPETAPNHIIKMMVGKKPLNIFRMIAASENVAPEAMAFGDKVSQESSLDPVLREIVILRTGHLSDAPYEIQQHTRLSKRIGMSDELIEAIGEYPNTNFEFTDEQVDYLKFTDAVVVDTKPSDEVFEPLRKRLPDGVLIEVVMLIGFYMMASRIMNTFELELEEGPVEPYKVTLS